MYIYCGLCMKWLCHTKVSLAREGSKLNYAPFPLLASIVSMCVLFLWLKHFENYIKTLFLLTTN